MGNAIQVTIVGGGAAGLAAAIAAARQGARVTVLEAAKRVGQKLLKTGNGRCNLTNAHIVPEDYNAPRFVERLLASHTPSSVLDFFRGVGLLTAEESEGRIYPLSRTANSVLDVLRDACEHLNVKIVCEQRVMSIRPESDSYVLVCDDGATYNAQRVIVATGGATKLLACLGHTIAPFRPVLCPIKTLTHDLKGLSGVRAHACVRAFHGAHAHDGRRDAPYFEARGEVLFRDYGLSGIVIFDLSRELEAGDTISLDFIPQWDVQAFADWLTSRYASLRVRPDDAQGKGFTYAELLCGSFHSRINNAIIRKAGLKPSQLASTDALSCIAQVAKDFRIEATGLGDAARAQVTRGGASVKEFDALTLESKLAPGVHAAGETLDVDGRCGGFNLHWAWASGLAAGAAASCE